MTTEDREHGWWEAPAGEAWCCPECREVSPVAEWRYTEAYCEDCGEHDARQCPRCDEVFDHVWGAPKIAEATAARLAEGSTQRDEPIGADVDESSLLASIGAPDPRAETEAGGTQ